jgi:hypothetical protein
MPFRNYAQFDIETLRKMTAAYDVAVTRLNIKSDDPMTSRLANIIVELASTGERDPDKLCEAALRRARQAG